jgi:hypothetical protein
MGVAEPTNAVYLRNIGLCYENSANAVARLAADETRSHAQRTKDWNKARSWFEKALGSLFRVAQSRDVDAGRLRANREIHGKDPGG